MKTEAFALILDILGIFIFIAKINNIMLISLIGNNVFDIIFVKIVIKI